jgi:tetratricopeptide (TPR) repeat protein
MGLLKAEQGDPASGERYLRAALQHDPMLAEAAYNLSVLLSKDRLDEAITWARKAADLRPREPKYSYTLAFFHIQQGEHEQAVAVLQGITVRHPGYLDAYLLLGDIYEKQGKLKEAESVYRKALSQPEMPIRVRHLLDAKLKRLSDR